MPSRKISWSRKIARQWQRLPAVIRYFSYIGTIAATIYAVAQAEPIIDPGLPALRYWVKEQMAPFLEVQNQQAQSLDRFLLFQQQQALEKAQKDPQGFNKQQLDELKRQIDQTNKRVGAYK